MEKSEWEVAWSENLSVGVADLDEEHRQFIAQVNAVNKAIIEAEDKAGVARAMEAMLAEAVQHFAHEEALMAEWKYPDAAAHAAMHAELMRQFDRIMAEFMRSDISYVWALKGLQMKQLLVEHLLQADMKYRDFLRTPAARG